MTTKRKPRTRGTGSGPRCSTCHTRPAYYGYQCIECYEAEHPREEPSR